MRVKGGQGLSGVTDVTDRDRKSSGNKDLVCTNKDNSGGKRGEVGGWRMGRDWKTRGEVSAMHNPFHRMCHRAAIVQTNLHLLQHLLPAEVHVTTHCPEFDEILQHGGCDEQTVHQRVGQEEDEELVIGEAHTVVDPGDAQLHS